MATTISSASGPLTLTTADNPLFITGTGAVTTTNSGTDAIYGGTAATGPITNAGVVSSSAGDGIVLEDGGSVTNNSTGTIRGDQYEIVFNAGPGSVTNSGSISSALGADSVAVDLGDGGSITNLAGGTIAGGNVFIRGTVGTITNSGIIATDAEDGVLLAAGGSVTNNAGGSISNTDNAGVGVFVEVASGMVTNAGSISALGGDGVLLLEGGSVSNAASGSITGQPAGIFIKNQTGTVTNAGHISGTGAQGAGVYLQNNGILTNASTGTIVGQEIRRLHRGGFRHPQQCRPNFGGYLRRRRSGDGRRGDQRRGRFDFGRQCRPLYQIPRRRHGHEQRRHHGDWDGAVQASSSPTAAASRTI